MRLTGLKKERTGSERKERSKGAKGTRPWKKGEGGRTARKGGRGRKRDRKGKLVFERGILQKMNISSH